MNSILKATALKIQSLFDGFDKIAKSEPLPFSEKHHYPIFILGAPRSGSTLLYQLLLRCFDTAYISNLMALVPRQLLTIARTFRYCQSMRSIKSSHFGYVNGLFSPSEAGAIQKLWFEKKMSYDEIVWIRNTFVMLSRIYHGPVIIKNLFNTLRLDQIRSMIPEARFIHIKRDPLFNAQSLLLARNKINGSKIKWWSIKPEGYENIINQEPEFQVLWQIKETERLIGDFFKKQKPDRFEITYEDLCERLYETLELISAWMNVNLITQIPIDSISASKKIIVSDESWSNIIKYSSSIHSC